MAHPPRIPMWLSADRVPTYFVTFCVAARRTVLADPRCFASFQRVAASLQRWTTLAAVMMPDHVHVLASPHARETSVGEYSALIKRGMRLELKPSWRWQHGCFDRLLRNDESAQAKWEYMRENPVRAGLVSEWRGWPYMVGIRELSPA